ncbi:hypothetical protein ACFOET_18005 [Parapedobacter deserti]|uniref:Uncharacterized protein n=1 Tax=Parapedobacter deserti TaxID=1912957 RepID=A0ABV7JND3_9SPHI
MKKITLLFFYVMLFVASKAQNTFPSTGNVGIGTTSPAKKLDVIGAVKSNQLAFPLVNYNFSAAPRTQLESMSIKLFDDYHTRRPGGSSPDNNNYGTLLAIYGYNSHWESNIYIGASTKKMYFRTSTWSGGSNEHGITGAFHDWRTILDSRSDLKSTGRLLLTGSGNHYIQHGNIGIGTTTPSERLSVNGNIRAKEVKVEMANWPDYVFQGDYRLLSLADLEAYINENGHLPGMPTAKEVEADGLALAEMNRRLLEKVEELTLHIINLNRTSELQNKEIAELKSAMKQR